MAVDLLYELAFAYRKEKLWKTVYDNELFAVALSNGEIGYCSVMGELGEYIALAVYPGQAGLDSYRRVNCDEQTSKNELKAQEKAFSHNCIQCVFVCKEELLPEELQDAQRYASLHQISFRGKNAFPQFVKYAPAHYPWPVSEAEDETILCEALKAALEVSAYIQKNGKSASGLAACSLSIPLLTPTKSGYTWSFHRLPAMQEVNYPSPHLRDELLLERLNRTKKTKAAWACDVVMFPQPTMQDDESSEKLRKAVQAPVFPFMLLVANMKTQMILPTDLVFDYAQEAETFLPCLAGLMIDHGLPAQIKVCDKRTESLLKEFSHQTGFALVYEGAIPLLEEMEDDLMEHFDAQSPKEDAAELEFLCNMVMDLDDDTLRSMPKELRKQLEDLGRQGLIPEEVALRVRNLKG